MKFITQNGTAIGPIGQGTWYLGEHPERFNQEASALRAGIEAGMNLIDTAEMYGDGAAEILVGEAIKGLPREKLYVVSKVYPWNAGRDKIFDCCKASLGRMKTDYMDLYLLHWQGNVPFEETIECMEELKSQELICNWGVSNIDIREMKQLVALENGDKCATDQVLYHLGSRGVEYDLLPWLQQHGMPMMAYCPLAQAGSLRQGILKNKAVVTAAANHNATPQQIMLAFILAQPGVYPIPRSSNPAHAQQNAAAAYVRLTAEEIAALSAAFPAPEEKVPLDVQ